MKKLSFILSIYFLCLALMPCTDGHTCSEDQVTMNHDHSDDEDDHCTPLCVCSCCGLSFTLPSNDVQAIFINDFFVDQDDSYYDDYTFSFYDSVWHPPTV